MLLALPVAAQAEAAAVVAVDVAFAASLVLVQGRFCWVCPTSGIGNLGRREWVWRLATGNCQLQWKFEVQEENTWTKPTRRKRPSATF